MSATENMPWMEAIVRVLKQAGKPMHYTDVAKAILDQKLRKDSGATPAATVNSRISLDIKNRPNETPFARIQPGVFTINTSTTTPTPPEPPLEAEETTEPNAGILQAFGMFWRRENVLWRSAPRLLGQWRRSGTAQNGRSADVVDFSDQRGVYLLHDSQRVVYVGKSADRPIGRRLFEHTTDRLNGRWDRFSWFGIRNVTPTGTLMDPDLSALSAGGVIDTLEALLIEGLEPPQNRQRGYDFTDREYIQFADPEVTERQRKALLVELMSKPG